MRLETWLELNPDNEQLLMDSLGVNHSTIWRWRKGKTVPNRKYMRLVEIETSGAVRPDDWFGTHEASE